MKTANWLRISILFMALLMSGLFACASKEDEAVAITETLKVIDSISKEVSFVFEEETGEKLYNSVKPQENAMDFTGEWNRTNVPSYHYGRIIISNQDESGFDFTGDIGWYAYNGQITDKRAFFVTENVAICEMTRKDSEEVSTEISEDTLCEYIVFMRTDIGLEVYATGIGKELGDMNPNCFLHGEYITGEPVFNNTNVLKETYTDEQLIHIKELIGEELYESYFVNATENGRIQTFACEFYNGDLAIRYQCDIPGEAATQFYDIIICDNLNIYGQIGPEGMFFTNDLEAYEMPGYYRIEMYTSYLDFKSHLNEYAPNLQPGDTVELPTDLDYCCILGNDVRLPEDRVAKIYVEHSYLMKHPNGKVFLVMNTYQIITDSKDYAVSVYDITSDSGAEIYRQDIMFQAQIIGDVSIERIEMVRTINTLGVYQSYKDYMIDENGKLRGLSTGFVFEPHASGNGNLKVKKELPVTIDGVECTIEPGEEIVITGCESNDKIYFRVVSTGQEGTIFYEKDTMGTIEIDGIWKYDYFENLLELSDFY